MRVLHVINSLGGGGAEHSLFVQLPPLRDLGVESSVVLLVDEPSELVGILQADGFDVTVLPGQSWPSRIHQLRSIVRSTRPDVVHATLFDASLASRLACAGTGVPLLNSLVNTSYDPVRVKMLGSSVWKRRVVQWVDGLTARHLVTHFHVLSDAVRTEAIEVLGIAPDQITVIPRGRSSLEIGEASAERRARSRRANDIADDAEVVLNVGRQEHQKAQAVLIGAFARVRKTRPDALLLIAGRDGAASKANCEAIEAHDLGGSVRILGHRTDVFELMAAADVYALPSHFEGLGCSVVEAMAIGLPVVGSDAPAVSEVLGGGRFGRVVPRNDEEQLADAISDLLDQPDERRALGEAGRARHRDCYELDAVVAATRDLYERVARPPASTRDLTSGAAGT